MSNLAPKAAYITTNNMDLVAEIIPCDPRNPQKTLWHTTVLFGIESSWLKVLKGPYQLLLIYLSRVGGGGALEKISAGVLVLFFWS